MKRHAARRIPPAVCSPVCACRRRARVEHPFPGRPAHRNSRYGVSEARRSRLVASHESPAVWHLLGRRSADGRVSVAQRLAGGPTTAFGRVQQGRRSQRGMPCIPAVARPDYHDGDRVPAPGRATGPLVLDSSDSAAMHDVRNISQHCSPLSHSSCAAGSPTTTATPASIRPWPARPAGQFASTFSAGWC